MNGDDVGGIVLSQEGRQRRGDLLGLDDMEKAESRVIRGPIGIRHD